MAVAQHDTKLLDTPKEAHSLQNCCPKACFNPQIYCILPPPKKKKNPGFFGAKSNPPVPEYTSAPSGLAGLKVCAYFGDLEVRLFA